VIQRWRKEERRQQVSLSRRPVRDRHLHQVSGEEQNSEAHLDWQALQTRVQVCLCAFQQQHCIPAASPGLALRSAIYPDTYLMDIGVLAVTLTGAFQAFLIILLVTVRSPHCRRERTGLPLLVEPVKDLSQAGLG
jgi:hypothetical protein